MKKKRKRLIEAEDVKKQINKSRIHKFLYLSLSTMVIFTMVRSFFRQDYANVFICFLTLALFLLPILVEKSFKVNLPTMLESIVLLFIFSAEILGEINSYYIKFPHWDTMLHTINGFLFAAVGFALVDILNRNTKIKFNLSPLYLAFVAFCFSMTIGVLWEFFEFGCDVLFVTDMQKDHIVNHISTVMLDPTNNNKAVVISDITEVMIHGEPLGLGGYLDIGLYDTMKDLFVNFIGAVVFSIIGYFYVKTRGEGKIARQFIPQLKEEAETTLDAPVSEELSTPR